MVGSCFNGWEWFQSIPPAVQMVRGVDWELSGGKDWCKEGIFLLWSFSPLQQPRPTRQMCPSGQASGKWPEAHHRTAAKGPCGQAHRGSKWITKSQKFPIHNILGREGNIHNPRCRQSLELPSQKLREKLPTISGNN